MADGEANRMQPARYNHISVTASRKPKTKTKSSQEWGAVKAKIQQLYATEGLPLPEVMVRLKEEAAFVQS